MNQKIEIFPWNVNFETGIASIDVQHKKLVSLLNTLVSHLAFQSDAPELELVFDELQTYAATHFKFEEGIWQEYFNSDSWAVWHHGAHDDFVSQIRALRDDGDDKPLERVIEEIVSFLTHWLALHIIESDKRMAKVVLALPSGISLERAKDLANKEMSGATRVLIDTVMGMYDNMAHRTIELTREISARTRAEAELVAAKAELARLRDEAVMREHVTHDEIVRLTNGLSHNLQEPVRLQMIYVSRARQLLEESGVLTSEIDEALHYIVEGAERQRRMLQDIQVHMGLSQSPWRPRKCDLVQALDAARSKLSEKIAATQAQIEVGPLPVAMMDHDRLVDIFVALLDNSLSYSRPGEPPHIMVDAVHDNRMVVITVADNGIGVPIQYRDKVFDIFERLEPQRKPGGTGYGLSMVKSIVTSANGSISIGDSVMKGAAVTIKLPVPAAAYD